MRSYIHLTKRSSWPRNKYVSLQRHRSTLLQLFVIAGRNILPQEILSVCILPWRATTKDPGKQAKFDSSDAWLCPMMTFPCRCSMPRFVLAARLTRLRDQRRLPGCRVLPADYPPRSAEIYDAIHSRFMPLTGGPALSVARLFISFPFTYHSDVYIGRFDAEARMWWRGSGGTEGNVWLGRGEGGGETFMPWAVRRGGGDSLRDDAHSGQNERNGWW